MNVAVVDCSVLAAVVFEEEWAPEAVARLRGYRLIAPALLPFELTQVCSTKMRRHPAQATRLLDQFVAALTSLQLDLEPVGLDELPALAGESGLSCHDAAYLWLALARSAPLVTFDDKLAQAHRRAANPGR